MKCNPLTAQTPEKDRRKTDRERKRERERERCHDSAACHVSDVSKYVLNEQWDNCKVSFSLQGRNRMGTKCLF